MARWLVTADSKTGKVEPSALETRIAAAVAAAAEVDDLLETLDTYGAGAVQDTGLMAAAWTTTNTTLGSWDPLAILPASLDLSFVGTGRPVEVTVDLPAVRHSVANAYVGLYPLVSLNGAALTHTGFERVAIASSPSAAANTGIRTLRANWDFDTVLNDTWLMRFAIYIAAGTGYIDSSATYANRSKVRNH